MYIVLHAHLHQEKHRNQDRTYIEDDARIVIAARGFWKRGEKVFSDVRVLNPFARTYLCRNLESLFKQNETDKKREYNDRVIRIEHGSFTPIVTSAYGGYGRETSRFFSTSINQIAEKYRGQLCSH